MKRTNKVSKLNLNAQTIRALTSVQLRNAAGGVPPTSHINGSFCCTGNMTICVTDPCSVLPTACIENCTGSQLWTC